MFSQELIGVFNIGVENIDTYNGNESIVFVFVDFWGLCADTVQKLCSLKNLGENGVFSIFWKGTDVDVYQMKFTFFDFELFLELFNGLHSFFRIVLSVENLTIIRKRSEFLLNIGLLLKFVLNVNLRFFILVSMEKNSR